VEELASEETVGKSKHFEVRIRSDQNTKRILMVCRVGVCFNDCGTSTSRKPWLMLRNGKTAAPRGLIHGTCSSNSTRV
jgi:hypothetical protein